MTNRVKNRNRICENCLSEFSLDTPGTRHKYCSLDCAKQKHAAKWNRISDGFRCPTKSKAYRLKHKFGLSLDDYEYLLETQGWSCAVCFDELMADFRTHVDHCHATGKVRGLLCSKCNQALGLLRENQSIMDSMKIYLERTQREYNL